VLIQVLLEVEVRERLALGDAKELLEGGIRLDVVLVLEALLLDVRRNGLRDVGAAHLAALRLGKEGAEVIAERRGHLEDGQARRLGDTILIQLGRAALALAGILDLTGNTLLELLELGVEGGDRLAEAVQGTDHATDLIANRLDRLLDGRNRALSRRGDNRRNDSRRSSNRLRSLRGTLGRRLLLGNNRRRRRGGDRRRDNRLNGLLLCYSLLGNSLRGGRGIHCTRYGGRR